MTQSHPFNMPFLLEADDAARRIAKALRKKTKVFNFPWFMSRLVKFTYWVPDPIMARVAKGTYREE